jgi:hypothetical protein
MHGVLYNPPVLNNLSLGLVMKNMNTPKFDIIDGGELNSNLCTVSERLQRDTGSFDIRKWNGFNGK